MEQYNIIKFITFFFNTLSSRGEFIVSLFKKDFVSKYHKSFFSFLWIFLNPIVILIIYISVFSSFIEPKINLPSSPYAYVIYITSGMILWNFFSEASTRISTVFLDNASLIKRNNFPLICLPISTLLNSLINFFAFFLIFIIFLYIVGCYPGYKIFFLIPIFLLFICFTFFLGSIVGILNVYDRNVGHFFNFVLHVLFWLTPIIYTFENMPFFIKIIIQINPIYYVTNSFQVIFLSNIDFPLNSLIIFFIFTSFVYLLFLKIFSIYSINLADQL